MGPNGDLMGTQKLKKVPMGTRVPKWGPMWEQCDKCGGSYGQGTTAVKGGSSGQSTAPFKSTPRVFCLPYDPRLPGVAGILRK